MGTGLHNTERTKLKVASEVIADHYRWHNKRKTLFRDLKPEFIPKNLVVSKKAFRHYLHVEAYENPIEKAWEYEKTMKNENLNQNQLAQRLGISRVRVNQYLRLLKLPPEQRDYILKYRKREMITERMLRTPLKIPRKLL